MSRANKKKKNNNRLNRRRRWYVCVGTFDAAPRSRPSRPDVVNGLSMTIGYTRIVRKRRRVMNYRIRELHI